MTSQQYIEGDIQAQLAALWACRDEIRRLAGRYGVDVLREGMREILDYTQRRTQKAIESIPDGVYEGDDYIDSDGNGDDPVTIKVKLTVDGDRVHVDMTGSDKQRLGPINSPLANTASAIYYSLKFFLDPQAPANAGMYRQIDFTIPEGTWLNPVWPAPTLGCTTSSSSKITGAIWKAIAQAIPEKSVASTYAEANWFTASVMDPVTDENYVFTDLPAGGWGGTPFNDGMHVTMDPLGNCQNLPAETAEMLFPLRYNAFEMIEDSAGAWADAVAELAGASPVGLSPTIRTIFGVDAPDGVVTGTLPIVHEFDDTFYIKPEANGLLCSPADETPSHPHDARPDEFEIARAIDSINETTTLRVRHITSSWAGLRTFAPDRSPVVGFDPQVDGLFWFAGQGGYGIQMADGLARAGAAILRGEPLPDDVAADGMVAGDLAPLR